MANKQHIDEFIKENLDNLNLDSIPSDWSQISKSLPKSGISPLNISLLSVASISIITIISILVFSNKNNSPQDNNILPTITSSDSIIITNDIDSVTEPIELVTEEEITENSEENTVYSSKNNITEADSTINPPYSIIITQKDDVDTDPYDNYDYNPYDMDLEDKSYLDGHLYSNGVRCDTIH